MRWLVAASLVWGGLLWGNIATADGSGRGCESSPPTQTEYVKAIQLGFKTQAHLEDLYQRDGDKVVLIARLGSDAPKKRFKKKIGQFWQYTHAGLAYRSHILGQWTVVHLLNTCDKGSAIFAQGLMRFALDKPERYSVAIGRLSPDLQHRLEDVIVRQDLAMAFHSLGNQYSSVSSPYNMKYQNSNEYILTTLAAAMAPEHAQPRNRAQAKDYFLNGPVNKWFEPELVKVGFFEQLGKAAGLGAGNASLDDHSRSERRKGRLKIVSVGSLFNMLSNAGALVGTMEIQ